MRVRISTLSPSQQLGIDIEARGVGCYKILPLPILYGVLHTRNVYTYVERASEVEREEGAGEGRIFHADQHRCVGRVPSGDERPRQCAV